MKMRALHWLLAAVGLLAAAFAHAEMIVIEAAPYLDVVQGRMVAPTVIVVESWETGPVRFVMNDGVDYQQPDGQLGAASSWTADEAAFREAYFHDGLPQQQLRFEQLAVRPLGTDHAMATGRFILSGGGEPDQTGWFTLVWMRTAAGWRTIHDHSS